MRPIALFTRSNELITQGWITLRFNEDDSLEILPEKLLEVATVIPAGSLILFIPHTFITGRLTVRLTARLPV